MLYKSDDTGFNKGVIKSFAMLLFVAFLAANVFFAFREKLSFAKGDYTYLVFIGTFLYGFGGIQAIALAVVIGSHPRLIKKEQTSLTNYFKMCLAVSMIEGVWLLFALATNVALGYDFIFIMLALWLGLLPATYVFWITVRPDQLQNPNVCGPRL